VAGIALVEQYADSLNDVDHALNRLKPPAPDLFQPQTLNGPNAQAGLDVWDDLVKKEEAAKKVAEEHAKAIRQLQDDLSGASALRSLNDLQAAWNSLTPAEQANAVAVGDVQKKYADLAAKLPELPPSLRSFAASMDAAQKASEPFTAGLDAAETAMHDLLEEASKLAAADLSKFTSAINDLSGQSGLEKAVYDFDALNAAIEQGGATAEGTKKVYDEVGAAINAILSGGARLTGSLEEQTAQWDKLTQAAADFSALHPIEPTDEALPKVIVKTEDWTKDIGELSHALADLAQISGGTFGKIFQSLSSIVGATNAAIKSIDGIGSAMDAIHKADGTKDLAKGFLSLTTSILGAVSAAIAFGEALVKAFKKDRAKEEVGSIAKEFGETVSKEFGQQIEDLAKNQFGGNRQAAKIFDLDQIISQGGGITAKNLGVLEDRLHDVFSLLQTGALSGDQAMQVLDKNFQTFVDYLGGNVDPALKNIIKLNDEFGTHSKAIAQYVDAQANTALSSLSKVVSARQSALDALNNAKTPDDRKKAQAQLDALPLTKNSGAAFGGALFGIFERLQKDGVSAIDTLKQIDPVIESLDKQFAQAGISGGAAFDKIKSLAGIATDEIAGPSFEAIQNYGAALTALNNANILDQETFTGLSEQITATYQAAVDALTKEGKDGSAALGLVAPDLQKIWELQQDFGYAVDDSTQALLDQAVAAGDVGEKHRSVQAQTLDVMKHLDAVLSGIGQKFGVDIPSDIDKTGAAFDGLGTKIGDAVDKIPDKINIPIDFKIPDNYQPPDHWTGPDGQEHPIFYAKGGPVYAAGGMFIPKGTDTVPAMLTPGEGVLSLNGMRNLGALNNGGTISGSAPTQTVVILQIDKREIGRAIADVLPGEVRRLGVRVRT
jgi:predicted  nucleic acid-binding Zn-ribbon protein